MDFPNATKCYLDALKKIKILAKQYKDFETLNNAQKAEEILTKLMLGIIQKTGEVVN